MLFLRHRGTLLPGNGAIGRHRVLPIRLVFDQRQHQVATVKPGECAQCDYNPQDAGEKFFHGLQTLRGLRTPNRTGRQAGSSGIRLNCNLA